MHSSRQFLQGPPATGTSGRLDNTVLLAHARNLQWAAETGTTQPLLRGKKLGLLCARDETVDAALFRRAALELGAHVAHVRPSFTRLSSRHEVVRVAQLLGRLYDAIECQDMPAGLVRQVTQSAGVPVYDGIAAADHPTASLCALLGDSGTLADKRRFVLQAVFLSTVG